MLNEFRISVQRDYGQVMAEEKEWTQQEREERLRLSEKTVDVMAEFMKQHLLVENEQKQYADIMDEKNAVSGVCGLMRNIRNHWKLMSAS